MRYGTASVVAHEVGTPSCELVRIIALERVKGQYMGKTLNTGRWISIDWFDVR